MEKTSHIPVMEEEVLSFLNAQKGGSFLDCTLGGAGHSLALLEANETNTVVANDRDSRAIIRAARRLERFEGRFKLMHGHFSQIREALVGQKFDGILADLGLSTDQLKENRGFSFNDTSELDMRMDESQDLSAEDVVNRTSEKELFVILKKGGIGSEARQIVQAIARARPLKSTGQLSEVVNKALGGRLRSKKSNPSTLVFQALRIAVNREFEEIEALLESVPALIKPGGRLAVISFHSLEDKLVAGCMRKWASAGEYPAWWRGAKKQEVKPLGKLLTKKAVKAGAAEVKRNPSARSALLRVFEFE